MALADFKLALRQAISALRLWPSRHALVVWHDDGDGVASGAILIQALKRAHYKVKDFCIEKALPEIVERLHSGEGNLILYADIGSGQIEKICANNHGKNLTIILDHHKTSKSTDEKVYNLNPELYGMDGESEASGSTVSYLFAKCLNEKNIDLAKLALIGLEELPKPSGALIEECRRDAGEVKGIATLHRQLTILASTGYYRNGPTLATQACLRGMSASITKLVEELEKARASANKELLTNLRKKGLNQTPHLQWFEAGKAFQNMGVKTIGTFCSYLSFQRLTNPVKYLLGFMPMPRQIPGLGSLTRELTKVSIRAPQILVKRIQAGEALGCAELLTRGCEALGGVADGHSSAASGVIPKGSEKRLIELLESECSKAQASKGTKASRAQAAQRH